MNPSSSMNNQYQAPASNVETADSREYSDVKILGSRGRIGRLRYLAYNMGFTGLAMIVYFMTGIVAAFLPQQTMPVVVGGLLFVLGLVGLVVNFLFAIQRSHDFNTTGWLSLITLIPFSFFVLLFIPGNPGKNNYGNPPPPNHGGIIATAIIAPIVFVVFIGILAAIAIPAYNSYIEQAKQAQQQR